MESNRQVHIGFPARVAAMLAPQVGECDYDSGTIFGWVAKLRFGILFFTSLVEIQA
jgi:hypothetical protein